MAYDGNQMSRSSLWILVALLASPAGLRAQAKAGVRTPVKDPPRIVCFGDSLTAGFGLDSGQSYPDLLQQRLDRQGYRYHIINMGISGDTTQDGLARLAMVIAEHPQIVVLEFGANDGLRGLPVSVAENNQARMIEALRKAGSQVVLAGMTLPPNYGPDYVAPFTAMYADLAKKYQLPLIPFLLAGVATKPDLMQADGLHPNAAGTKLVVENVMRALQPLLRR
jgi:acyl-CoA thioesterase I